MKFISLLIFSLLWCGDVLAGSISSSGGKFIGTESNPWFLENTKTVIYCVDVDPSAFRPSRSRVQEIVRLAISHWVQEFSSSERRFSPFYAPNEIVPYGDVRLGTQEFVEVDCHADVEKDLRFQFGSLTEEQKLLLPNFKDYIGVAVRTSYDLEELRGKGFIYVAADSGPNRPTNVDFADDPWAIEENEILKIVLLHELGHIFGLSHSLDSHHVMSENLIDRSVSRSFNSTFIPILGGKWYYTLVSHYKARSTACTFSMVLRDLFHLKDSDVCVKLRFFYGDDAVDDLKVEVLTAKNKHGPYVRQGLISGSLYHQGSSDTLVRVKFSDTQKVFKEYPDIYGGGLPAGYIAVSAYMFYGNYQSTLSTMTRDIIGFVKVDGTIDLISLRNGRLHSNMNSRIFFQQ